MSDVDFSEVTALGDDLINGATRVGGELAKIMRNTAADIEATAKQLAPVDTGRLRDSIEHEVDGDGRSTRMRAWIGPTVPYAHLVEFGTARQAPQPFLFSASDRHEEDFVVAVKEAGADLL